MNRSFLTIIAGLFATVIAMPMAAQAFQAHAHIGHVATSWGDTPDNAGLLTTAEAEGRIALQHAELAVGSSGNLGAIKAHAGHVMHALDPESQDGGPGLGYGLLQAAQGAQAHMGYAAGSEDASEAVTIHAQHIDASLSNVINWSEDALDIGDMIMAADDADNAAELAGELRATVDAIVNGMDADGDGSISWQEGEGGLAQARLHLGLMMKAEGLE